MNKPTTLSNSGLFLLQWIVCHSLVWGAIFYLGFDIFHGGEINSWENALTQALRLVPSGMLLGIGLGFAQSVLLRTTRVESRNWFLITLVSHGFGLISGFFLSVGQIWLTTKFVMGWDVLGQSDSLSIFYPLPQLMLANGLIVGFAQASWRLRGPLVRTRDRWLWGLGNGFAWFMAFTAHSSLD